MIASGVVATPSNDNGLIIANGVPQTRHNGLVIVNGLSDRINSYIGSPTARLNIADGTAFAWISEKNLALYLGHKVVFTDTAGKEATGYIKEPDVVEALSSDLFDAGAGIFTAGTYSWVAYGTNTIANDTNTLKITFDDSALGAYIYLQIGGDLTSNLTVGKLYKLTVDAKVSAGNSVSVVTIGAESIVTETTMTPKILYFSATSATFDFIRCGGMSAGEIIWLDNLIFTEVTNIGATGVHIVSAKDGVTRNWASIDSGFDPNDIDFVNVYDK